MKPELLSYGNSDVKETFDGSKIQFITGMKQNVETQIQPPTLGETNKPTVSALDLLKSKSRQNTGRVNEIIELRGNVNSGTDQFKNTIVSMDAVRIENNNQLCRVAFKVKDVNVFDKELTENAKLSTAGEEAQILIRLLFKLKRADDTTYFISKILDFEDKDTQ